MSMTLLPRPEVLPLEPPATSRPVVRILFIGGGGHLGRHKLQPVLARMRPWLADCLEQTPPPLRARSA